MIKLNVLKKNVQWYKAITLAVFISVFCVTAFFYQPLVKAAINPEDTPEDTIVEKDKTVNTDPRIIVAMKTTMYDQVADDEDIDIMAQWIKQGAKDDDNFKNDIYTIIKNDCTNCHSKTSSMTRKVPYIPFASYEDIKPFTKIGPTNAKCLECHGDPILKNHSNEKYSGRVGSWFSQQRRSRNSFRFKQIP